MDLVGFFHVLCLYVVCIRYNAFLVVSAYALLCVLYHNLSILKDFEGFCTRVPTITYQYMLVWCVLCKSVVRLIKPWHLSNTAARLYRQPV